jgi:hypothetical protein
MERVLGFLRRVLGVSGDERLEEPRARPFVTVTADRLAGDPGAVWSDVASRLMEVNCLEHLRLARTQRVAWLVLTYDAIVRGEGHRQYFRIYGVGRAAEVRVALAELGADTQCRLLAEAIGRDVSYPDDYETLASGLFPSARRGQPPDYTDLDIPYRLQASAVRSRLEQYMRAHFEDFVEIEGEA